MVDSTTTKQTETAKNHRYKEVNVSFEGYYDKENYGYNIEKALENGEMPKILLEKDKLIGEGETKEADLVINYIRVILNKLSQATKKEDFPDIEIFLSDQNDENAAVITKPKKPMLITFLGLIESLNKEGYGEDQLAAVLGHEHFHLLRHNKWKGLKNGRAEESSGDIFGVHESFKAGYNPKGMGDYFRLVLKKTNAIKLSYLHREDRNTKISTSFSVHPSLENRIRNTDVALAALQMKHDLDDSCTKIPNDVLNAIKKIQYKNKFTKHKEETDFYNKKPVEQFKIIAKYIEEELKKRDLGEAYSRDRRTTEPLLMTERIFAPFNDLQDIKDDPDVRKEALKQFKKLMTNEVIEEFCKDSYHSRNDVHYKWVLEQMAYIANPNPKIKDNSLFIHVDKTNHIDEKFYRIGKSDNGHRPNYTNRVKIYNIVPPMFLKTKSAAKKFWRAKSKEEAIEAAINLHQTEEALSNYSSGMDILNLLPKEVEWIEKSKIRKLTKKEKPLKLKWEKHLTWMNEGNKKEKEIIRNTLTNLGCEDPRVTGESLDKVEIANDYNSDPLYFNSLHINSKGIITELAYTQTELEDMRKKKLQERFETNIASELFDQEYTIEKAREKEEQELVAKTNWSKMEKDFWGFIEKNQEALSPVPTVIASTYPFAEEFMHRLEKLANGETLKGKKLGIRTKRKWQQKYNEFITGNFTDIHAIEEADTEEDADDLDQEEFFEAEVHHNFNHENPVKFSIPYLFNKISNDYFGYHYPYTGFNKNQHALKRGALPKNHPCKEELDSLTKVGGDKEDHGENYDQNPPKIIIATKDKEDVIINTRINSSHPYVKALLPLDNKFLLYAFKANLLSHFRFYKTEISCLEDMFKISPRDVFQFEEIKNAKNMKKLDRRMDTGPDNYHPNYPWYSVRNIEILKTLRKLDKQEKKERFSLSGFDAFLMLGMTKDAWQYVLSNYEECANKYNEEFLSLLEKQVEVNRVIDFDPNTNLETLIKNYIIDHGTKSLYRSHKNYNIFAQRPKLENDYQDLIKARITSLPLNEQAKHLTILMRLDIKEPEHRNWATDQWVKATGADIGKDIGEKEYKEKTLKIIKDSIREMSTTRAVDSTIKLLDEIEAQKELTLETKELLIDRYGQKIFSMSADLIMRGFESIIDCTAQDDIMRDEFLKYITEPLTDESSERFTEIIMERARYTKFVKKFYNNEKDVNLPPIQKKVFTEQIHKNIWDMPFELRTVYLDRILFPTNDEVGEVFEKSIQFILDKVLPTDKKFAEEAREALLVYLDTCPKELRRITFSALLATAEESAKKGSLRPGEVVSHVLTRSGAAGGMLLQAMHSYLSGMSDKSEDLEEIHKDLASSKVNFDKPKRWEVFERMDDILLPDVLDSIKRVGSVLGSGSTAYVVACEKKDHKETAIKMMREDVLPTAELQFSRFKTAFEKLAEKHRKYKPLPEMVDSARELLKLSVDGHIAEAQIKYAQENYNKLSITVNGKKNIFNVAKPISAGDEYIETDRVKGKHLNDLTPGTYKQEKSIAIETAETYNALKGKATDKDRHGGQQGINHNIIGMFDVGQIPFDIEKQTVKEPNKHEKYSIGRLLGITFNAAAEKKPIAETFIDAVDNENWGKAKDYIVTEKRSLLARMDVHNGFTINQDDNAKGDVLADIFKSAILKGNIDSDIMHGVASSIKISTILKMSLKSIFNNKKDSINIKISDNSNDNFLKMPKHSIAKAILKSKFKTLR